MFRLTRQVRFAINAAPDEQLAGKPANSFGGFPSLTGLGYFFMLDVTVRGPLDPATQYLLNIKSIDDAVRREIVPLVSLAIVACQFSGGGIVMREVFDALSKLLGARVQLDAVTLRLSPTLCLTCLQTERPMVRLSQKFEFAASHRLHNPALDESANRTAFGKCNNPHGHGHNYEVQVTIGGVPDDNGIVMEVPRFERIVDETIVRRFDHKNLNVELPEFRELNPTVENIAMTIHRLLKPALSSDRVKLLSVTVWETPKTWCEYSELGN